MHNKDCVACSVSINFGANDHHVSYLDVLVACDSVRGRSIHREFPLVDCFHIRGHHEIAS
jgi:hypothetical protein